MEHHVVSQVTIKGFAKIITCKLAAVLEQQSNNGVIFDAINQSINQSKNNHLQK